LDWYPFDFFLKNIPDIPNIKPVFRRRLLALKYKMFCCKKKNYSLIVKAFPLEIPVVIFHKSVFSVDQNYMEGHQKEISPFFSYLIIGLINNIRQ
jgi:hypothetical protein